MPPSLFQTIMKSWSSSPPPCCLECAAAFGKKMEYWKRADQKLEGDVEFGGASRFG